MRTPPPECRTRVRSGHRDRVLPVAEIGRVLAALTARAEVSG